MKDTKKIKKNLFIGVIGQLITLILGIIVPKLVLTSYGSEVNGLLSSITNIYAYIAIVETGIAAAASQALYKAIAEKDNKNINSVLSATNKYYHKTGFVYLALIVLFSILYPLIVKTEIPFHTIAMIIVFNGLGNVINYFFHGKYLILLRADGKNYIRTGIDVFTVSAKQISKVLLISLGYDVVLVQFAAMLVSFAQMIYITCYIKKKYAWIDLKVKPDYKSISQSKNVFIHQINYFITSNADVVILTAFTTLKTVSVYSMYILIFSMADKILHVIRDAIEFKIANYYYTSKEKFLSFFRAYEIYYTAFAFALYSVVDFAILPFLKIYTAEVTDINYVVNYLPMFFVWTRLWTVAGYPCDAMIHISGHFKQTQSSAIIEAVINVVVSLALVHSFGIAGVLLGTIVSLIYRAVYRINYVHKNVIEGKKMSESFKTMALNSFAFVLIDFIENALKISFSSYLNIALICVPYAIIVFSLYFVLNSLVEQKSFRVLYQLIMNSVRKRNSAT